MKTKDIEAMGFKNVSLRKGVFKVKQSFFYGMFANLDEKLARKVKEVFPDAIILDKGMHWHEFVGGAKSGSAKDSFVWVTFTFPCMVNVTKVMDEPEFEVFEVKPI